MPKKAAKAPKLGKAGSEENVNSLFEFAQHGNVDGLTQLFEIDDTIPTKLIDEAFLLAAEHGHLQVLPNVLCPFPPPLSSSLLLSSPLFSSCPPLLLLSSPPLLLSSSPPLLLSSPPILLSSSPILLLSVSPFLRFSSFFILIGEVRRNARNGYIFTVILLLLVILLSPSRPPSS